MSSANLHFLFVGGKGYVLHLHTFLLQESVKALLNSSKDVLYYNEDQTFPGPVTAPTLRADAAHFGILKMNKVRGSSSVAG